MTIRHMEATETEGHPLAALATAFDKLTQGTLTDRAYLALRSTILAGDIPPRTLLRETDVAMVIPISRTPIREALTRLAAEGLLTTGIKRAMEVKDVDLQSCLQAYEILEVLEPLAVRLAAVNATEDQIIRMRECLELKEFFVQHRRWDDVTREAQRYHELIYEAGGNLRLAGVIQRLREDTHRFRRVYIRTPKTADGAVDEDDEIVSLIAQRNANRVQEVMRRHIHVSTSALRQMIEEGKTLESLEFGS